MDFGIRGKVAVVTGGATGIGHAIARTFHEEGATVIINGRIFRPKFINSYTKSNNTLQINLGTPLQYRSPHQSINKN